MHILGAVFYIQRHTRCCGSELKKNYCINASIHIEFGGVVFVLLGNDGKRKRGLIYNGGAQIYWNG